MAEWFAPKSDAAASATSYQVGLELPGVQVGVIDIAVHGDTLVVSGETRVARDQQGECHFSSSSPRARTAPSSAPSAYRPPAMEMRSLPTSRMALSRPRFPSPPSAPRRPDACPFARPKVVEPRRECSRSDCARASSLQRGCNAFRALGWVSVGPDARAHAALHRSWQANLAAAQRSFARSSEEPRAQQKQEFSPDFEGVPNGVDYALWRESGGVDARDREEMAEDALGASGAILSHADHALAGDRPL